MRNLSILRDDAELEGEAQQGLLVAPRLEVGLQQPLSRHHVVPSGVHVLFGKQKLLFTGVPGPSLLNPSSSLTSEGRMVT